MLSDLGVHGNAARQRHSLTLERGGGGGLKIARLVHV